MDGQYIIKNVLIIAAAFGLAARNAPYAPYAQSSSSRPPDEIEVAAAVIPEVTPAAEPVVTERRHRRSQIGHRRQAAETSSRV
jgi:hypothetical protein